MTAVRPPAVAGRFYPADPAECRETVDGYLAEAAAGRPVSPRAVIVPHAGYVYSGAVAATAYARLRESRASRVLLLGPAHTVALRAMAVSPADSWASPLGEVPIDTELRRLALDAEGVVLDEIAHRAEHSLEVQIPFLQRSLGEFTVLPVVVGAVPAALVDGLIDRIWDEDGVLVVVSTDLSHYHGYDTAVATDARTAGAVAAADGESIGPHDACGVYPLRGLLSVARRRGLSVEQLDLRNSGDTAGRRDRVVGYGAWTVG